MKFEKMCKMLLCRQYYNGGESVKNIAREAKVSQTTIRRWLKTTGL